jgi:hypothetical protein
MSNNFNFIVQFVNPFLKQIIVEGDHRLCGQESMQSQTSYFHSSRPQVLVPEIDKRECDSLSLNQGHIGQMVTALNLFRSEGCFKFSKYR